MMILLMLPIPSHLKKKWRARYIVLPPLDVQNVPSTLGHQELHQELVFPLVLDMDLLLPFRTKNCYKQDIYPCPATVHHQFVWYPHLRVGQSTPAACYWKQKFDIKVVQ